MKISFFPEPELEFANGRTHVDVRFGIMQHGPLDRGTPLAPSQLKVGFIGTDETIDGVRSWLLRSRNGIPAKNSKLSNLFPPFPGFSENSCFGASLIFHERWCASIHKREIDGVVTNAKSNEAVQDAADLFLDYAKDLTQQGGPMVLICAPPRELLAALESKIAGRPDAIDEELDEGSDPPAIKKSLSQPYFHDVLKARGMILGIPIQMVRPDTYSAIKIKRKKKNTEQIRPLQDEATRAWNFHTALYYKAGGIPWRCVRDSTELTACYVGVSFYKSLDGGRLLTSVAQVFNERGEGVIVKGGEAVIEKDDRQPHLSAEDANSLLRQAIQTYRREHKNFPARLVIHKTSKFSAAEVEGFQNAAAEERIDTLELLSVRRSLSRLFREGTYPPLRGTFLEMDDVSGLIYLRGSVNFFETYPGMYVPRPLEFSIAETELSPQRHAQEILSLSKLNWNNTQFDGGEPITVRAARRVGEILKCIREEEVKPSFRFFM
ncbi:argonaute/piwi family protein [Candidatus Manganitrophus noduliformans]|uniref:Protein argonaute n=1 Tax=Candidatus Manganitrophus noduliformans TaxID=2606439 RepID=A0A7X6I9X9_9BACT|nr:hypothetical protein [Candidatus Manganitrophus noduliformans]NKE70121.1 hypothetical protein [Candidatus Manganitrophus noduliformans]